MAKLAIRVGAFISSPADMQEEREAIDQVLANLNIEARASQVYIDPFRWERDARPGRGRPLDLARQALRNCDLVIAVVGDTIGTRASRRHKLTGTQEEFAYAKELHAAGALDDIFLYFRRPSAAVSAAAKAWRDQVHDSLTDTYWTFDSVAALRRLVSRHTRAWFAKWHKLMPACWYALSHKPIALEQTEPLGADRLHQILQHFDPREARDLAFRLGRDAVQCYQRRGPAAWAMPVTVTDREATETGLAIDDDGGLSADEPRATPLRRRGDHVAFASPEWFAFFCALGLVDAVHAQDLSAISRHPYPNTVHQYVPPVARLVGHDLVPTLRRWLRHAEASPTARHFSAYQLGMHGDRRCIGDLHEAMTTDRDADVRFYCIASLGKLRAKQFQGELFDLFVQEAHPARKQTIAEALCRIAGVADFEL